MTPDKKLMIRRLKASGFSDAEIEAQMGKASKLEMNSAMNGKGDLFQATGDNENFSSNYPDGEESSGSGKGAAAGVAMGLARGDSGVDVASSGLMMSGNQYAMGAGLGLAVLSAGAKRKQQEQELKAKMKLDRISKQQVAIQNLMNLSQGMGL